MAVTNERTVAVFGGTGFLGRRVVRHLRKRGFSVRIASRHPDRDDGLFALEIRNFNRSKRISTTNNRSRMRLLALTVW